MFNQFARAWPHLRAKLLLERSSGTVCADNDLYFVISLWPGHEAALQRQMCHPRSIYSTKTGSDVFGNQASTRVLRLVITAHGEIWSSTWINIHIFRLLAVKGILCILDEKCESVLISPVSETSFINYYLTQSLLIYK